MAGSVSVKVAHGLKMHTLTLPQSADFAALKKEVEAKTMVPEQHQRLLFRGRERDDSDLLRNAGLREGSKVILDDSSWRKARVVAKGDEQKEEGKGEGEEGQEEEEEETILLSKVVVVRGELDKLEGEITKFERGEPTSYESSGVDTAKVLDELLTRQILKLDDIDTHGIQSVREARKEQIKRVDLLSAKIEKAT